MSHDMALLCDREFHICWLVMRGWDNKTIAYRLHLKLPTIKNTLASAMEKIGIHNRTSLAVWMVAQTGILEV
jgi:DNA-binding NarL/FixJ family response regulator